MVRKFRLAAPRAEIALPRGRSLRDLLFGRSANVLVRLLTVPARPQSLPSAPAQPRNGRFTTQTASVSTELRDSLQETRGDGQLKRKADVSICALGKMTLDLGVLEPAKRDQIMGTSWALRGHLQMEGQQRCVKSVESGLFFFFSSLLGVCLDGSFSCVPRAPVVANLPALEASDGHDQLPWRLKPSPLCCCRPCAAECAMWYLHS